MQVYHAERAGVFRCTKTAVDLAICASIKAKTYINWT
jgi:hypothetical protein